MKLWLILSLVLFVGGGFLSAAQAQNPVPDGHWWLAASAAQRDGFELGSVACENLLQMEQPDVSKTIVENAITGWYRSHAHGAGIHIVSLTSRLKAGWRSRRRYKFVPAEPQWLAGEAWRELSDEGDGIVFGFIACQAEQMHHPVKIPLGVLLARVNRYYGIRASNPGGMNMKRWKVKISTAILLAEKQHP